MARIHGYAGGSVLNFEYGGAGDTTPDIPAFAAVPNATPSTVYESNIATLVGFDTPTELSLPSGGEMRVNGGAYATSPVTVSPDDTLQLRTTSAAGAGQAQTVVVYAGALQLATWTVVTAGHLLLSLLRRRQIQVRFLGRR